MGRRLVLQVVVAVVSGSYTAASLTLDAFALFPTWHWQYHALIGFLVFAGIMIWMVLERQLELNTMRPNMVLGNRAKATLIQHPETSELDIVFHLLYRNTGKKPAHQLRFRVGFAPLNSPQDFQPFPDYDSANPIDPGGDLEHGRDITLRQKYTRDATSGKVSVDVPKNWLIYCAIRYSDLAVGGRIYNDERWFEYKLFGNLSHATIEQKTALEPYVRAVYAD